MAVSRFPLRVALPVLTALALFSTLAVGQELGALAWLDSPVLDWLEALRTPGALRWVRRVTELGDGWILTGVVAGAAAVLWRRHRRAGAYLLITGAGSALVGPLLKSVFARPRPDAALRLVQVGSSAFPSGHSFGSAVVYGAVAVAIWGCCPRLRGVVAVACVSLVLAIGVSRVVLRVHYPSDVLAGWSLGAVWSVTLGRWLLDGWVTIPRPSEGLERERQ